MTILPPIRYVPAPDEHGFDTSLRQVPLDVLESALRASEFHDRAHAERLAVFVVAVEAAGHSTELASVALLALAHNIAQQLAADRHTLPADWVDTKQPEGGDDQ